AGKGGFFGKEWLDVYGFPTNSQLSLIVDVQNDQVFGLSLDRAGRADDRQFQRHVQRRRLKIDHQHEEGDQLKHHVENRRQVWFRLIGRVDRGTHGLFSATDLEEARATLRSAYVRAVVAAAGACVAGLLFMALYKRRTKASASSIAAALYAEMRLRNR